MKTLSFVLFLMMLNTTLFSQNKVTKIVIDAGHGGVDPGAVYKNTKEKDIALNLALNLGKMLKKDIPDIKIYYTRLKDNYVELYQRPKVTERNNADLFISIHVNSSKNTNASGTMTLAWGSKVNGRVIYSNDSLLSETIERENKIINEKGEQVMTLQTFDYENEGFQTMMKKTVAKSEKLAELIEKNFAKKGFVSLGTKHGNMQVLRDSKTPAVLIEVGFLSNSNDRKTILDKKGQDKIVEAIFLGIKSYITNK